MAGLPRLQLTGPGEGKGEGVGELPRQPQGEDAAVPVDRVGIDREGPGIGTGETGVQDRLVVSELMDPAGGEPGSEGEGFPDREGPGQLNAEGALEEGGVFGLRLEVQGLGAGLRERAPVVPEGQDGGEGSDLETPKRCLVPALDRSA